MDNRDNLIEDLSKRLREVEKRLSSLESGLRQRGSILASEESDAEASLQSDLIPAAIEEKGIESAIGRIGLAWLGMIVLLFGIIFLTEHLNSRGTPLLSVVIGYMSVAIIYILARYFRRSNHELYLMFGMTGLILVFYITMRLNFFSAVPLLPSRSVVILLLMLVVAYAAYLSVRRNIRGYGVLAVIFTFLTSIVSDSTHVMLPIVTAASAGSVYYFYSKRWNSLLLLAIILSYTVFFLWMVSNPLMNHPVQLFAAHQGGYIYLFTIGGIYSLLPLLRDREKNSDDFIIAMTILHGVLFTMLLAFVTVSYFKTGYVLIYSAITLSCICYSIILKERSDWKFPSAFFALYGFMGMSIALYGMVGLPLVYLLLSFQSLLVVSIALWFRNRLIIIMNSLLFLFILFIYLISSKPENSVSFSFAVVALVSARIINWKKERLEIKTDLIRNLYLLIGFFMMMFALLHAVPKQFVALSWTIAALAYFGLSFILKNVKYRYMALATMISAAIYLFVIDLARVEVIYRVLALLVLAAVSIGISVYYANRIKKTEE